jgi:hypothetical protein
VLHSGRRPAHLKSLAVLCGLLALAGCATLDDINPSSLLRDLKSAEAFK